MLLDPATDRLLLAADRLPVARFAIDCTAAAAPCCWAFVPVPVLEPVVVVPVLVPVAVVELIPEVVDVALLDAADIDDLICWQPRSPPRSGTALQACCVTGLFRLRPPRFTAPSTVDGSFPRSCSIWPKFPVPTWSRMFWRRFPMLVMPVMLNGSPRSVIVYVVRMSYRLYGSAAIVYPP